MFLRLCLIGLLSLTVGGLLTAGEDEKETPSKPRVLLLGDSISIGYTPFVQEMLKDEATVKRPMKDDKPENCSGTLFGVKQVDRWLSADGGQWDVVHFNFGLHDLKRVDSTGAASANPEHPRQSDPEAYEKQLREIVAKLKKSGAMLILATTTPVPEGKVSPHRDPDDVVRYNQIARKVAEENGLAVNDLYGFALPKLKDIQRPVNVHFTDEGSKQLAAQVVEHVRKALKTRSSRAP